MRWRRWSGAGLAVVIVMFLAGEDCRGEGKWRTYHGAWFEINYPAGFTVKPGQKSSTHTSGCDSASFVAPDQSVVFSVFSPQWRGQADEAEIEINPDREEVVEQHVTEQQDQAGMVKTIRAVTVRAKDNSYRRAFRDESTETTRLVFGIRYKDKASYEKYYNDYLAFKKSLKQFAD